MPGLSFSQYGPQAQTSVNTSPVATTKTNMAGGRLLSFGAEQGASAKLKTNTLSGSCGEAGISTHPVSPTQSTGLTFPIDVPVKIEEEVLLEKLETSDEKAHGVDSEEDVSCAASVKSVSSTDTVVPPVSRRGSGEVSTAIASGKLCVEPNGQSCLQVSERARKASTCSSFYEQPLDLDFPMPPSFHPAAILGRTSFDMERPRLVITPPLLLTRAQSCVNLRSPVLGADEDVELSPPTSLRTVSPQKSFVSGARDPSASGWMDDEDDEDEDERSVSEESVDGDTVYEDAVSMLSMSEEEFEDAVSMLSGVFYSARTSLEL